MIWKKSMACLGGAFLVCFGQGQPSIAQSRIMSYVQINQVSKSGSPLHLDAKHPAACGSVYVNVFAFKHGSPDPVVSVELDGYSGATVDITPEMQSKTIAPKTFAVFTFKVCAKGSESATATVQAGVASVGPDHSYEIRAPDPAETARVTFDVVP